MAGRGPQSRPGRMRFYGSSAFSFQVGRRCYVLPLSPTAGSGSQGLAAWVVPELVKRPQDDARREHLGQHQGGLSGEVKDVGRHTGAAELAERGSDVLIVLGPVGADQHDSGIAQAPPHIATIEDRALINLAAQAPAGGEIDKHRPALGAVLLDGRAAVRLPTSLVQCWR